VSVETFDRILSIRTIYENVSCKTKRRFQMLTLGPSRTVHLRKALAAPCYWFEQDEVYEEDGRYRRNPDLATI
jgi:hypothetical protein